MAAKRFQSGKCDIPTQDFHVYGLDANHIGVPAFEELSLNKELAKLVYDELKQNGVNEAMVLSTCNRFQIFYFGDDSGEAISNAMKSLYEKAGRSSHHFNNVEEKVFEAKGMAAVGNFFETALGLNSNVVGDSGIHKQYRNAIGELKNQKIDPQNFKRLLNKLEQYIDMYGVQISPTESNQVVGELTARSFERVPNITVIGTGAVARDFVHELESRNVKYNLKMASSSQGNLDDFASKMPLKMNRHLYNTQVEAPDVSEADVVIIANDLKTPLDASLAKENVVIYNLTANPHAVENVSGKQTYKSVFDVQEALKRRAEVQEIVNGMDETRKNLAGFIEEHFWERMSSVRKIMLLYPEQDGCARLPKIANYVEKIEAKRALKDGKTFQVG